MCKVEMSKIAQVIVPINLIESTYNVLLDIMMQSSHMQELKLNKQQCREIGTIIEKLENIKNGC